MTIIAFLAAVHTVKVHYELTDCRHHLEYVTKGHIAMHTILF